MLTLPSKGTTSLKRLLNYFRRYYRSWLAALLLALGGVATLGLPGAVIFELTIGILEGVGGISSTRVPPDTAWPIALYLSLLWPFSLPLAAAIASTGHTRAGRLGRWLLSVLVVCAVLSLVFYLLAVS